MAKFDTIRYDEPDDQQSSSGVDDEKASREASIHVHDDKNIEGKMFPGTDSTCIIIIISTS